MRLRQASVRVPAPRAGRTILTLAGLALAMPATPPTAADVFHLTSGGRIDGELLERSDGQLRVRTVVGIVAIAADAVERVEPGPSPFQEYEERRASAPDTAPAQLELAHWCAEQGLQRERLLHLHRALELAPDDESVRAELGYVRVGDLWVKARATPHPERTNAPDASTTDTQATDDPLKLTAVIQGNWRRRIAAVRASLLESSLDRLVDRGRQRIAEIRDPLAIGPLVAVLSEGRLVCREVLVEALIRFPDDAATVNLAALALLDPDAGVRRRAVAELVRRRDARVTGQLRKALESGEEVLVRRAAEALGALQAREAIPELINALTSRQRKMVEVPVPRYLTALGDGFSGSMLQLGSTLVPIRPAVAISNPAMMIELQRRLMDVTVFRTEVLEALRQITGRDFGFETGQWARWYQESKS